MSGILDSKSRVIDAILTNEGRRQLANSNFEVSYVTFSDVDVAYEVDPVTGHVDPTGRIYLEACNLPQDRIVFEADDTGHLIPLRPDDIPVTSFEGNLVTENAGAFMANGKLFARERQYGSRIKCFDMVRVDSDAGTGFIYSGHTKTPLGNILIDPTSSTAVSFTAPIPGNPYVAKIGTKTSMNAFDLAKNIATAINTIKDASGPSVTASYIDSYVHLDYPTYPTIIPILKLTGSMSSPLELTPFAMGGRDGVEEIQVEYFGSQITSVLTSSFDNFLELRTLSTQDPLTEEDELVLSKTNIVFDLEKIPYRQLSTAQLSPYVDEIDSVFTDDKMSHLENFMYLPPIVKVSDTVVPDKSNFLQTLPYQLGNYPSWGDNERMLPYSKFLTYLSSYSGVTEAVEFLSTSNKNNILCQVFEVANGTVKKLDIVEFHNPDTTNYRITNKSTYGTDDKIFFVGKTFLDSRGTACYVNMFTLVFSSAGDNQ